MKVVMPRIGMTMQDGTIVKWYKAEGETITAGEPMMDIETEKFTNTVPAPGTGVFHILVEEGEVADCGEEIAEIDE